MKEYDAAVAYLDFLGIGPLTRGGIALTDQDFLAFSIPNKVHSGPHPFAAHLLVSFRNALRRAKTGHPEVEFSQLSDSAFLWSKNSLDLVNAARGLMWELTLSGVFCRGGMSYGSIIEPDKVDRRLGAFILGQAVTEAVKLERAGKGCRLFSSVTLPSELMSDRPHRDIISCAADAWDTPFAVIRNPLDGAEVDEFRWYLFRHDLGAELTAHRSQKARLMSLVELLAHLRLSPRFRWNTASPEGLNHIAVSIEALSAHTAGLGDDIDYAQSAQTFFHHPTEHRSIELTKREYATRRTAIKNFFSKAPEGQPFLS